MEYKAEKAKNIKEKLHRDRDRISVNPRKQPPREAAAAATAADAAAAAAAAELVSLFIVFPPIESTLHSEPTI